MNNKLEIISTDSVPLKTVLHTYKSPCNKNDISFENKCIKSLNNQNLISQCNFKTLGSSNKMCDEIDNDENFKLCHQPAVGTEINLNSGEIICNYDLDLIDDIEMLEEFYNKFGILDKSADKVFQKLCSLTTTDNCMINKDTNKPFTKCMYLFSNNKYGNICNEWANVKDKKKIVNEMITNWCKKNYLSDFCLGNNNKIDLLNLDNEKIIKINSNSESLTISELFQNKESINYIICGLLIITLLIIFFK